MADYGFRVTRDACGKHSEPEVIARSWDLDEAREMMYAAAQKEADEFNAKGDGDPVHIVATEPDIREIRQSGFETLMAYYEVEEFEQC